MNEEILNMLKELRPEFDFAKSQDFITDGFLDSFDIVSLSNMLEEKYGISIDGLDIVPENYSSVDAIVALVKKSGRKSE